jgi:hypothetical protein
MKNHTHGYRDDVRVLDFDRAIWKNGKRPVDPDRAQLTALLVALEAQDHALRHDECDQLRISGRAGHIYNWGDGSTWLIYVRCRSRRAWSAVKALLSFCEVTQDGDDEGCLRLRGLPTHDQATAIRKALDMRKRKTLTPASLTALRKHGEKTRFQRQESLFDGDQVAEDACTSVAKSRDGDTE